MAPQHALTGFWRVVSLVTFLTYLPTAAGAMYWPKAPIEKPRTFNPALPLPKLSSEKLQYLQDVVESLQTDQPTVVAAAAHPVESLGDAEPLEARTAPDLATTRDLLESASDVYSATTHRTRESDLVVALREVDFEDLLSKANHAQQQRQDNRIKMSKPFVVRRGAVSGSGSESEDSNSRRVIRGRPRNQPAPSDRDSQEGVIEIDGEDASQEPEEQTKPVSEPAAGEDKGLGPDEMLAAADDALSRGEVLTAALYYFDIQDFFPGTETAFHAEDSILELARQAEAGNIQYIVLQQFLNALPLPEQCESTEGKYWRAIAERTAALTARNQQLTSEAQAHFENSLEAQQQLISQDHSNPLQVSLVRSLVTTAEDVGPAALNEVAQFLLAEINRDEQPTPFSLAATGELINYYVNRVFNIPEGSLFCGNLIDSYRTGTFESLLADESVPEVYRAHLMFYVGYAHFQLEEDEAARDIFEQVTARYTNGRNATELAAYYTALTTYFIADHDAATGIDAFDTFLSTYPEGLYAQRAYFVLANIYGNAAQYTAARQAYQNAIEVRPDGDLSGDAHRAITELERYQPLVNPTPMAATGATPSGRTDCGPRALTALLKAEGVEVSIEEVRSHAPTDAFGTSAASLIAASQQFGFPLQAYLGSHVDQVSTSFIAHLDGNHFAFVKSISRSGAVIIEDNEQKLVELDRFNDRWGGFALAGTSGAEGLSPVDAEIAASVYGASGDSFSADIDNNRTNSDNQHGKCGEGTDGSDCPECCPPGGPPGGPGGNGPNSEGRGSGTGGSGGDTQCMVPPCPPPGDDGGGGGDGGDGGGGNPGGACPTNSGPGPTSPFPPSMPSVPMSLNPNASFALESNTAGISGIVDPFQGALILDQSDLAFGVRGPMSIEFQRNWHGNWGGRRDYYTNAYPWSNNLGAGWTHSLNQHLRVSSGGSYVVYVSARGNVFNFTKTVDNVGGYDYYYVTDTNSSTDGNTLVLRKNRSTGTYHIDSPNGVTSNFSASLDATLRYCRLASYTTPDLANDIQIDFYYDFTDEAVFGQLTKVAPSGGDARDLYLEYDNDGRITRASIRDSTVELKYTEYFYDNNDELTAVSVDGSADAVEYAYATFTDTDITKRYLSSITDRNGNVTSFETLFDIAPNDITHYYEMEITYASGLKTVLTKENFVQNWNFVTIYNRHNGVDLTRMELTNVVQHGVVHPGSVSFFPTPASNTPDTWTYGYTAGGNITSITAPDSVVWAEYTYTSRHRFSTATWPTGQTSSFVYTSPTSDDQPKEYIAPNGLKTYYYYDSAKRLTRVAHPSTSANNPPSSTDGVKYLFDQYSQKTKFTNQNGESTHYEYDAHGNITRVILPDDSTTSPTHSIYYIYDSLGNRLTSYDPLGNTTAFEYIGEGCGMCGTGASRVTKITAPSGAVTRMEYDKNGNTTKVTDALSRITTYEYDSINQMTKVNLPGSRILTVEYNKLGQMTKQTDVEGKASVYEYDFLGRVTSATDAAGVEVNYEFDKRGNMTKVIDALSHATTYAYDNSNRLLSTTDALGKKTIYSYDSLGRTTKVNPGPTSTNEKTEYTYNSTTGVLSSVKMTSAANQVNETIYSYDLAGRLTNVNDWMGGSGNPGHDFEYNSLGRLTKYRDFDDDPGVPRNRVLQYVYDHNGRVVTMTDYEGYHTVYTYTVTGQVSTITAPGSKVWDFDYNLLGQRMQYTHPNGMKTVYSYDSMNRMTKIDHNDGAGSPVTLDGWEYRLGADGNILSTDDLTDDGGWDYGYDKRDRLVQAVRRSVDGMPRERWGYTYDARDNMLSKERLSYDQQLTDTFADNNYTSGPAWTIGAGTWSAASGYMENASSAITWPNFRRSETFSSFVLDASFYRIDGGFNSIEWRDAGGTRIAVYMENSQALIRKNVSGLWTTLDTNANTAFTTGQWYDIRIIGDGGRVWVLAGKQGEGLSLILTTTGSPITTATAVHFGADMNQRVRYDNIRLMSENSTAHSFTDEFTDGNYTASPAWTVDSGTWAVEATNKYLHNTNVSGDARIVMDDIPCADGTVRARYRIVNNMTIDPDATFAWGNGTDFVGITFTEDDVAIWEDIGGIFDVLGTESFSGSLDTDYDIQVHIDGNRMEIWRGNAGGELALLVSTNDLPAISGADFILGCGPSFKVRFDNIAYTAPDPQLVTYAYNNANELTSMVDNGTTTTFTYDDYGRTLTKTQGAYEATYKYRYGDKVHRVDTNFPGERSTSMLFDGLGKRRYKGHGTSGTDDITWYRYDLGWNVLGEYDYASTETYLGNKELGFVWHGMTPLAEVATANPSTGTYSHYAHDHLGSARAMYDGSKAQLASIAYDPYGQANAGNAGKSAVFTFTGKPYEAELGMYFFPYRFYNPQASRWITRDPLGMVDGPNVYAFVGGKPINYVDPWGTESRPWPFNGSVCNDSDSDVAVLMGEGEYCKLGAGECTQSGDMGSIDADGVWGCDGSFYPVNPPLVWHVDINEDCGTNDTGPGQPSDRGCETDEEPEVESLPECAT